MTLIHPQVPAGLPNLKALLDTGSPYTFIHSTLVQGLWLPEVDPPEWATLNAIGAAPRGEPLRAARLTFLGLPTIAVKVAAADLKASDATLDVLVGRDVLEHYVFTYDGPTATVTLALP